MENYKINNSVNLNLKSTTQFLDFLRSFSLSKNNFDELAGNLMQNLCLYVGENRYQVTECEIYYYDKTNKHFDPYCHKSNFQLKCGTFYYNGFGLDLTFGNSERNIFGGVLIRGIKSISENTFINGPIKVMEELIDNIGSAFDQSNKHFYIDVFENQDKTNNTIYKTSRIGLPKKDEDYFLRHYRYINNIENKDHNFKNKYAFLKELLKNKVIENTESFIGYNIKTI